MGAKSENRIIKTQIIKAIIKKSIWPCLIGAALFLAVGGLSILFQSQILSGVAIMGGAIFAISIIRGLFLIVYFLIRGNLWVKYYSDLAEYEEKMKQYKEAQRKKEL